MTEHYKMCLDKGLEYQDFIAEVLLHQMGIPLINYSSKKYQLMRGENKQGIEIKLQSRMKEFSGLWIEIAEKSNPSNTEWIKSGIYRNDAWLFISGDYEQIFIFAIKTLIKLHLQIDKRHYKQKEIPTSKGFILPLIDADKYCLKKLIPESVND